MKPLVSVIVANYNRADLIEETLESIQGQTYSHFECLIIDDQSTDNSEPIIQKWIKRDNRFQYYRRPDSIKKGANACRNWGFKKSKGELIKFFDSDDIMLPNHIEVSVDYLLKQKLDFVVVDCQNFDKNGLRERPYETNKDHVKISPFEFAKFQNAWITNDLMLTRKYAGQIMFNEDILDVASEYQYGLKLLLLTQNGIVLPYILTHRRLHHGSLFLKIKNSGVSKKKFDADTKLHTALYLSDIAPRSMLRWFIEGYVRLSGELASSKIYPPKLFKSLVFHIKMFGGVKTISFILGLIVMYLTGQGYALIKFARS